MVHPHLRRSLVALSLASFGLVGCVPYSTYQQVKLELEKAKDANADLVKKYNQAIQKIAGMKGGDTGDSAARLAQLERENDSLKKELAQRPAFAQKDIEDVPGGEMEEGGMRLGEALLFNEGEAKLKPEAGRILDQIVNVLRSKYPEEMVIVEGHTDNQPLRATKTIFEHNLKLGFQRAYEVFKYFTEHGIPEERVVVNAYSFNKPINPADQDSREARRKNRRVVVRRGLPGTRI